MEGEDIRVVDRVSEDSVEGEDVAGGCGQPSWEGRWGRYVASTAVSSAANSVLIENCVNAESKLDEDERRLSSWVA